ncbi:uncharacterized protein LOC123722087 [Papilio machaon]|uniref:uncharacterized protein LOC123722087 n=1 Tax=Papilio machaon TaxID=76193 RepID=UPI001E6639C5|nr:uncharacterized protein LOC123722087 [Papilio machaon]
MSQKVFKFGSNDLIKFITIYRNHECLWDTENENYKNRDARNTALIEFVKEFGVEGFGPKEITTKIKSLRTQYHAERKKIKDSMDTASGTDDVYKSKLSWYNLMDSFVMKTSEHRETTSNMNDTSVASPNMVFKFENTENFTNPTGQVIDETPVQMPIKRRKKSHGYKETASKTLKNIKKRARLDKKDNELDNFGKYVASSLRRLCTKNIIHAQDEIQAILSKYKLQELNESLNSTPTPESLYSKQSSEDAWCDL